jgi:hypothetical protein
MILEHALPQVKPGQEADFEPAVAKARAGSVSSCGMPAASGPGLTPGTVVVPISGHSPARAPTWQPGPTPLAGRSRYLPVIERLGPVILDSRRIPAACGPANRGWVRRPA